MKIIDKKEAKRLLQTPKKNLQINEAVFVLQKEVEALEKRITSLEVLTQKTT